MQSGCDYNFFKEGIQPVWEVPDNKMGGRLIVQVFPFFFNFKNSMFMID